MLSQWTAYALSPRCVASHAGKGRQTLALPPPEPTQRVTYHPYSAPLHRIKTDNMLPMQLLTPFQARSAVLPSLPRCMPHAGL